MAKIVVPTTNTTITSAWGKSVADALNEMYLQGKDHQTATTNASGAISVTFPVPYTAIPVVVGTLQTGGNTPGYLTIQTVSATAFTVTVFNSNGTLAANQGHAFSWLAFGIRP